jgi:hypothetical protein
MRAPNKPERKKDKEKNYSSVFSFFLIASVIYSVLFYSILPALAADDAERLSIILIDGGEIYVRSGSYYTFPQDYQLYVKGADTDEERVWLELRREGVSLKDDIATNGSQFVYSYNSTEILNLTVSRIYKGADEVLVRFSPVYQYRNPQLPTPQASNGSLLNSSDNAISEPDSSETLASSFNLSILFLCLGTVLLLTGFLAGKRRIR